MKAVVFDETLKLDKNYEKPIPQKGEALIRVSLCINALGLKYPLSLEIYIAFLGLNFSQARRIKV